MSVNDTQIQVLIDTKATVNVMDTRTLKKLASQPVIQLTRARIYPLGSKTPLPVIGVIDAVIATADAKVKTTFQITQKSTGALLGCGSA